MVNHLRPTQFACRALALTAFLGASAVLASAQMGSEASPTDSTQAQSAQALNLQVPTLDTSHESLFSSSNSASSNADADTPALTEVAANNKHFNFANAMMQYGGGRRRYGRPRYRGGNTNQDGSPKYTFFVGAGMTVPQTDEMNYVRPSYSFQVGGGRNFNKNFGLNLQFDWDNFGFKGQTLANQSYVYFGDGTNSQGLDGNSHIWSLTLNPTFYMPINENFGAYFVVGGGFYHKAAKFFIPQIATGCSYYYGCYNYVANATLQNYSSNSTGVNGGFGLTYKLSRFSKEQLYAEIRAVHTFNNYRPGITAATSPAVANAYTGWNYFPQNSQESTYLPIKVGMRF